MASECSTQMINLPLIHRLSSLLTRPSSLPVCLCPMSRLLFRWGGLAQLTLCVSPSVAMATLSFPTLLILLSLSSITLLLLTLLPTVAPLIPFSSSSSPPSPWPSPSCGLGQSWAVRLHAGPHYKEEDGEPVAVQLDVIANRVQNFMNIFCWYILSFI